MSNLKTVIIGFIVSIILMIIVFLYGKYKGKEETNAKALNAVKTTKDIDSLSYDDLYNIMSKRVHK